MQKRHGEGHDKLLSVSGITTDFFNETLEGTYDKLKIYYNAVLTLRRTREGRARCIFIYILKYKSYKTILAQSTDKSVHVIIIFFMIQSILNSFIVFNK